MIESCLKNWGFLDIVVNNAGKHVPGNSQELEVDDWDRVMAIN
jgi:meso-butanediol dehydrogenase/(S,S)-butanediol dehydrogenase/diacetyl reductase